MKKKFKKLENGRKLFEAFSKTFSLKFQIQFLVVLSLVAVTSFTAIKTDERND